MSKELTKEQQEELEKLQKEILDEAKKVVDDYVDNPSDISGSTINIHQNSPFLDSDEDGEPMFSGSRWTKVIRSKI
jgi:Skp family chaperone for outer membrane proteins